MPAYELVFWLMLGVFGISLVYPWHPAWWGAKWLVHLPLLLFPMWLMYEGVMPSHMNIRLDLPLIILGLMVSLVLYVIRLVMFAVIRWHG